MSPSTLRFRYPWRLRSESVSMSAYRWRSTLEYLCWFRLALHSVSQSEFPSRSPSVSRFRSEFPSRFPWRSQSAGDLETVERRTRRMNQTSRSTARPMEGCLVLWRRHCRRRRRRCRCPCHRRHRQGKCSKSVSRSHSLGQQTRLHGRIRVDRTALLFRRRTDTTECPRLRC